LSKEEYTYRKFMHNNEEFCIESVDIDVQKFICAGL